MKQTIYDFDLLALAYAMGLPEKIKKGSLSPQVIVDYAKMCTVIPLCALTASYKFHQDATQPGDDQIFVFGSNLAGIHGAGAARAALDNYGAVMGFGVGMHGRSYALPTKDEKIETLDIRQVMLNIANFKAFAILNPGENFFMTRVGCGLAGFTDYQIAPLFVGSPENIDFPENWKHWLGDSRRVKSYDPGMTEDILRAWAVDADAEIDRLVSCVASLKAENE